MLATSILLSKTLSKFSYILVSLSTLYFNWKAAPTLSVSAMAAAIRTKFDLYCTSDQNSICILLQRRIKGVGPLFTKCRGQVSTISFMLRCSKASQTGIIFQCFNHNLPRLACGQSLITISTPIPMSAVFILRSLKPQNIISLHLN